MLKLSELTKGDRAVIKKFEGISNQFQRRLYDIGISIESEIILKDILGFGKLFYISVDDVDFCIRKTEAEKIVVEKVQ